MRRPPKVTVYMPAHNYGRYVDRAVQSVFAQSLRDWELIIIDDGSTDDTPERIKKYEGHARVRVIRQNRKGLSVSNNIALRLANGRYIMRLDADDYLDENALLVMSNVLDRKPGVGLVYPDYWLVDDEGEILEAVRRKKIGDEARLLDLPAHGACTMFRKECLVELGGYEESIPCQDGYDLWLRFIERFKPDNVNVPLFYYRQHEGSLTKNARRILETRAGIKRRLVQSLRDGDIPKVVGIIPVAKRAKGLPDSAFAQAGGKPLLWHSISQALAAKTLDKVVVASNDPEALVYARRFKGVLALERPDRLADSGARIVETVRFVLDELKRARYSPQAAMLLYTNCPLRRAGHIDMAVDAMTLYGTPSVISVVEETAVCYQHGKDGLHPVQPSRDLQIEKRGIYKENGAVLLARTDAIDPRYFVGADSGHVVMLAEDSLRVRTDYDLWLADKVLSEWRARDGAAPARRETAR